MPLQSKSEQVRSLFEAYRAGDRAQAKALLTDDFRFTSPYDDAIDKTAYFERCWPSHTWIREHRLEKIVEDGDDVIVLYECITTEGKEFRNTEILTFRGDRISAVHVYFGAAYKDGVFQK